MRPLVSSPFAAQRPLVSSPFAAQRQRGRSGGGAFLTATILLLLTACTTQPQRTTPSSPAAAVPAEQDASTDASTPPGANNTSAAPATPSAPAQLGQQHSQPGSPPHEQPPPHPDADAAPAATPPEFPLRDGTALFALLRSQLADPSCRADDRVVARWLAFYARSPGRFAANLERVLPLMAYVLERVHAADLPGEFALLPIVESWYRPDAHHAGAAGLWQFSSGTAQSYGLRVGAGVDQRLSPSHATDAALAHLADLMQRFGDWRLAAMAYNAGAYRLARAHDADPAEPSPAGHRPAGLSMVTYEHLAKLHALACLVLEPERVQLELPGTAFQPLTRDALLAMAGTARADRPADGRVHEVRQGESLWTIARRHGLALADLLRWNGLDADAVIRPGQRIRLSP